MKQQQQGDVTIERVNSLPQGAKAVKATARGFVLAEGESTGHAHRIEECAGVELYEHDGKLFLKNERPVELTHEEHHTQTIEPGVWEIGRVFEKDHLNDLIRQVRD